MKRIGGNTGTAQRIFALVDARAWHGILAGFLFTAVVASAAAADPDPRYLAFQLFTSSLDSAELRRNIPPLNAPLDEVVDHLIRTIGTTGSKGRHLGFVVGPISFDSSDDDVRRLIRHAFRLAREKEIAVGFHIDDSMFWGRLKHLDAPENLERASWAGSVNTGRRLEWSSTPVKIMPQLCLNSPAVRAEAGRRAAVIGEEIKQGLRILSRAGKENLFLGAIVGWETQIGRDFESGNVLGYCALANRGFGPKNLPKDIDAAREAVVQEYIDYWATELARAGAPRRRLYSHIAFMSRAVFDIARRVDPHRIAGSYSETVNFTPPSVAFGKTHYPGFTTYPQFGHLEDLRGELKRQGNPPWASSEGTAADPGEAERGKAGMSMEAYLGNLFNHGARVVNLFGWGVGDADNPFRRVAGNPSALAAYRKFLAGGRLAEIAVPKPRVPSTTLPEKMQRIQRGLPAYIKKNGGSQAEPLVKDLENHLKKEEFEQAETTADKLLRLMDAER